MEKAQQLKEIISKYWQLPGSDLDWTTEFGSRQLSNFSSLRMLRFLASVEERFQFSIEDVDAVKNFQDLRQLVENS